MLVKGARFHEMKRFFEVLKIAYSKFQDNCEVKIKKMLKYRRKAELNDICIYFGANESKDNSMK